MIRAAPRCAFGASPLGGPARGPATPVARRSPETFARDPGNAADH
ncbi:hypothetical protein ISF6_0655 [Piscinibacter sakaiensis]|uniref:Uncharacterized protein n=1 Tax=Piscinibacter sakaiensis TaxID=1547922 RepID=A0A0K8NYU8_PISS1|nr:hypothetical protein ISF6_0655 [Piscinibacter sakaiensis]